MADDKPAVATHPVAGSEERLAPASRAPLAIALASPYDYAFPGGVTQHVRALAHALRARGHHVDIIAPSSTELPPEEGVVPLDVSIQAIPMSGAVARVSLAPGVWRAVRNVLHTRHYDVIHVHEPTAPPLSLAVIRHAQAPVVGTFHQFRLRNPYTEVTHPWTRTFVDQLRGRIAVSAAALESAAPYFPGDYRVIPNGVNLALYQNAAPLPRTQRSAPLNILFVGRLESRKGLRYLLQAFRQVRDALPGARLWVVGAYGRSDRLLYVRWLRQFRVQGVRFIGPVAETEKARWYRSADVFCAPSTGYESFGIVLIEAMAAGVAVVASDIPGYREVIQNGETGVLVPPEDADALADALVTLLQAPHRRARLAAAAAQAVERYDWSVVTAQIEQVYYEAIHGGASSSV